MKETYDGDPRKALRYRSSPDEPPRVCVWEITLKCNLGCRHCGSRAGAARPNELSLAEALETVRQLAELGVREVILIGGEAYLREDWMDIAHAVTTAGMACSMVTGAYKLDDFHIQQALAAGIRLIGISIDGVGATHDHLRGRIGSYEAAIDAARRIRKTGRISLSINSQVNRLSLPELPRLAQLVADLDAGAWQLQLTVALGRAADRPDMLLQPYQMLALMPLLHQLKRDILDPAGVQLFLGNNIGYFGPLEHALRYGGEWSGCMAGRTSLGLEADGTLKGCPSLPTEAYGAGSVRDTPIETMWRESSQIKMLGERTRADLWGFCASCEHGDRCLAGCTWTAHALFGRPGNNPFCHHRALSLAASGKRERIAIAERAPGRPFDYGRFDLIEEPIETALPDGDVETAMMFSQLLGNDQTGIWSQTALSEIAAKAVPPRGDNA